MSKTIEQQIEAVGREIVMRERVYPKRIKEGKMTYSEALHQIECMKAIRETLERARKQPALL